MESEFPLRRHALSGLFFCCEAVLGLTILLLLAAPALLLEEAAKETLLFRI
jgi:hypothetical protein